MKWKGGASSVGISIDPREVFAKELESMLKKTSFEKIRVNDLVVRCNTSRTTFYRYFRDKHDIVAWIYDSSYQQLIGADRKFPAGESTLQQWQVRGELVFYTVLEKRSFYKSVIQYSGQNSFIEHFIAYHTNCFYSHLKARMHTQELPPEICFSILFYYAGLAHMVKRWIITGMKESPREMQRICERNIPNTMMNYLSL